MPTGTLPDLIAEPLQAGRLKSPQTMPYARVTCELDGREPTGTAGTWFDKRRVKIFITGVKADVVNAVGVVQSVFNRDTVLSYPSTDAATLMPRFIKWWPDADVKLYQDPDTKDGKDVWVAELGAVVTSVRAR